MSGLKNVCIMVYMGFYCSYGFSVNAKQPTHDIWTNKSAVVGSSEIVSKDSYESSQTKKIQASIIRRFSTSAAEAVGNAVSHTSTYIKAKWFMRPWADHFFYKPEELKEHFDVLLIRPTTSKSEIRRAANTMMNWYSPAKTKEDVKKRARIAHALAEIMSRPIKWTK